MSVLRRLPGRYAVCRLPGGSLPPQPPESRGFYSVTVTEDEVSVVCAEGQVPAGAQTEPRWRIFAVAGPLDFGLVGVLAAILTPLAEAGVPVFVLSTFDTDLILVRDLMVPDAVAALRAAGHTVYL